MDHAGIERAHLLGFSMARHVALTAALLDGGRIDLGCGRAWAAESSEAGARSRTAMDTGDGSPQNARCPCPIPMLKKLPHFGRRAEGEETVLGRWAAMLEGSAHGRSADSLMAIPPAPSDLVRCRGVGRDQLAGRRRGLAGRHPGAKGGDFAGLRSLSRLVRPRPCSRGQAAGSSTSSRLVWSRRMGQVPFKRAIRENAPPKRQRAARRFAGEPVGPRRRPTNKALAEGLGGHRVSLSEIAARVFSAGFVCGASSTNKWPGFEEGLSSSSIPSGCCSSPRKFFFCEKIGVRTSASCATPQRRIRVVPPSVSARTGQVRERTRTEAWQASRSFLAGWPADDQVGLMEYSPSSGSRWVAFSGQYLLRVLGWGPPSLLSGPRAASACGDSGGVAVGPGTSKKGPAVGASAVSTHGSRRAALPVAHISRICAFLSIGEELSGGSGLKEVMQMWNHILLIIPTRRLDHRSRAEDGRALFPRAAKGTRPCAPFFF